MTVCWDSPPKMKTSQSSGHDYCAGKHPNIAHVIIYVDTYLIDINIFI